MAFSKCVDGSGDGSARWIRAEIEPDLPSDWKKFVCIKDNKPIKKLAKYEDPAGIKYKNMQSALAAFVKMKSIGIRKPELYQPAPYLYPVKRKSLPLNIEEVSPTKRLNTALGPPSLRTINNGQSHQRRSLPPLMKQKSEPVIFSQAPANFSVNHAFQGLEKSCNICNIAYDTSAGLEVHMKEQHGIKSKMLAQAKQMVQCDLCQKSYQTLDFLKKHKLEEHQMLPIQPKTFNHTRPLNYPCPLCNEVFQTKREVKKHSTKLHGHKYKQISQTGLPLVPSSELPRKSSLPPPGPPVVHLAHIVPSMNDSIGNDIKEMFSENVESFTKSIDVFSCEECGVEFHSVKFLNKHMKDMHESPEKAESGPDQIIRRAMEESQFPSDLFGEIEDLEFQEEYDVENSTDPQTGMNDDDEIEEYYDDEEFDDNKVLQNEDLQRRDNDHWKEDYDEEELEEEEEYYDVDENEQDDIEVISSGVKKLPQFSDEIEVVEDKSAIKRNILNQRPMVRNQSLNNIKNRYSQITITNNAVMPDDDGSPDDEDYSDLSDEDNTGVPEEITLDDEPDEITLDEEEEGIEDITEVSRKGIYEKEQIDRIERYEAMIAKTDFVKDLIETPENVSIFRLNAWYAQPSNWKPTKLGEVWNATVPQICFHLKLHDYPLQSNWSFRSWEAFDEFFTHLLENLNPGKLPSDLYKLKKAKWFQYLDPVIPQEMRITVETLEEEELGEDIDILTL